MEGTRSFHIPSLRSSFQNSVLSSSHKSNFFKGCERVPQYCWVLIVPALTSLGKGRQIYGSPPMLKALWFSIKDINMTKFLRCKVLVAAFLFSSVAANAEPASPESIKALMQSTGSGEMGMQMMNQMLPALKQMIPSAPESFWTDVMSEVDANDIEDMVIPVYQKYLTEEDIQAVNSFYQTEAGQKLIRVQPTIMQESMAIGQQWGQNLAKQVLLKYQKQSSSKP